MSRFVSRCCSCSFAFNITCPGLKVPNKPTVTDPDNGCVLNGTSFTQCGNPVWAYGDTLSAVNGIITGADDSEDAACTHACCIVCCSPRVQFNLCTCPEVYSYPGVYYHRIRYVTDSFEVSDFSEPGCFCVAQGLYEEGCACRDAPCNVCILGYNDCRLEYCVRNDATNGVNQCVVFDLSFDCTFNTIEESITCDDVYSNDRKEICYSINPLSDGTYLPVGTVYTRATTYGGFCCDVINESDSFPTCISGNLYVFALCDGVNDGSPNIEGCNCIQLFATYTHDNNYGDIGSKDISYKFDVSPFCTFDPGFTTTACGPFNVFIPKDTLAGGGACPNYYVRACLESNTMAPPVVRCAILGNVTKPEITGCNSTDPSCYGGLCTGTIDWNGEIAIYGIGSGGVGGNNYEPDYCSLQTISREIFSAVSGNCSGSSGRVILKTTSGKCGCNFCLVAGSCVEGQWINRSDTGGRDSFVEIVGDTTYTAPGARPCGKGSRRALPGSTDGQICWPYYGDLKITNPHGASGVIKPSEDSSSLTYNGSYTYYGNNQTFCDSDIFDASLMSSWMGPSFGPRLMGICCNEDMSTYASCLDGVLNYYCKILPDNCIDNCKCVRQTCDGDLGLNTFGVGGFGAILCKCRPLCDEYAVRVVCPATKGFGFGAGGPSDNISCTWCGESLYARLYITNGLDSNQYAIPISCACHVRLYYGDSGACCCAYKRTSDFLSGIGTGGAAGMVFLCNCLSLTCADQCIWAGRMGYIVFACQDFE